MKITIEKIILEGDPQEIAELMHGILERPVNISAICSEVKTAIKKAQPPGPYRTYNT